MNLFEDIEKSEKLAKEFGLKVVESFENDSSVLGPAKMIATLTMANEALIVAISANDQTQRYLATGVMSFINTKFDCGVKIKDPIADMLEDIEEMIQNKHKRPTV
jgi:hypothetical protein